MLEDFPLNFQQMWIIFQEQRSPENQLSMEIYIQRNQKVNLYTKTCDTRWQAKQNFSSSPS